LLFGCSWLIDGGKGKHFSPLKGGKTHKKGVKIVHLSSFLAFEYDFPRIFFA